MTERDLPRYPGYDVLNKRWTPSWNEKTRQVIDKRLAVAREPRFFTPAEWATLSAICERIMLQPHGDSRVPLPAYVDEKMFQNKLDGYRYAQLPEQREAWRRGLAALEAESQDAYKKSFTAIAPELRDALLTRMQKGELKNKAWGDMPPKLFFEHRVIPDITHPYYSHPIAWNELGFGGPASPRGYVRMQLNRRDPWEPAEAKPGEETKAREKNRHVG